MEQIYERNCPECGKKMIYKSENSLYQGEYRKSKCYKCAFKDTHKNSHNKISQDDAENIISDICKDKNYEFIGFLNGEFIGCRKSRLILKCNIDNNVWDVLYDNFVNKKSGCPKCGIELSKKTKQLKNKKTKIRNLNDGNNYSCSLETRLKRQKSMLGRKVSDETRKKQRISRIKNIEEKKGQCIPNYNIKGCDILNNIMNENNTYIQHAENGGEYCIKELGYWLDGYDKENNIAYEIDEKSHFNYDGTLKEKDIKRQKEIMKYLGCIFIRIKID